MKKRDHSDLLHVLFGLIVGSFFLLIGFLNSDACLGGSLIALVVCGIFYIWAAFVLVIWMSGNRLHEVMFGDYKTRKYF